MTKIAKYLTDYIIRKGLIFENERKLYEYGFLVTIEVGLFVLTSFMIALLMHMIPEGILFFVLFVPLRSYAGGLHLKKYYFCFALSCLVFSGTLFMVKQLSVSGVFSFKIFMLLEIIVYILYPVEHSNRSVDENENVYFRKKLKVFLLLDFAMALFCMALKKERYLLVMVITFAMAAGTMIVGKCKQTYVQKYF